MNWDNYSVVVHIVSPVVQRRAESSCLAVMPVHRAFWLRSVTMIDPTEEARRALVVEINCQAAERAAVEARYGQVWNTSELTNDFEVLGFAAPFVVVRRKADNKVGSLMFQHHLRYYFSFKEDQ